MKGILLLMLPMFAYFQVLGQSVKENVTLWKRLHVIKKVSQRHSLGLLVENRQFLAPWRGHIFLAELNAKRKISSSGSVGLHASYLAFTLPHDPEALGTERKPELRLHQSFTYRWKQVTSAQLTTRLMLEARFFRPVDEGGGHMPFHLKYLRVRLRLRYMFPVMDRLKLIISDEGMVQSPGDLHMIFDQNRLDVVFRYQVTGQMWCDLGYLNWYQRKTSVRYLRHSIRTGVLLRF